MFLETLDKKAVCAKCGKEFNTTPQWYWYYGSKIVCSYKCMRAMERDDPKSMAYQKLHEAERAKKPKPPPFTQEEYETVREMYEQHATYEEIAEAIHRSTGSIAGIVHKLGCTLRRKEGLNPETVQAIRNLWAQKMTGYQIAKTLGVSTYTVYKYAKEISQDEKEHEHESQT